MTLKIGVLASTKATDMQAIIDSINARKIDAEIAIVISDNKHAGALERAHRHSIDAVYLNPNEFRNKEAFDSKIVELLMQHNVEILLLIGYNRIVRAPLLEHYKDRIMNIHPSLLPEFAGAFDLNVHEQVLSEGRKETGCTLHFVTEDVDEGPIIMQKKVKISKDDNAQSLKEKVQKAEQDIILKTLQKWIEGKVFIHDGKVKIDV